MSCEQQVRADRMRAFVVLHVQFIPLVPLGFWKHWQCSSCGRPPSCPPTARTSILALGAVVFGLFGLFGLLSLWVGLTVDKVETAVMLAIGTGFCGASAGLSLWCVQRNLAPSYAEKFADVAASDATTCPGCGAELEMSPVDDTMECVVCGIQRL
jgi:hypothetical protein